MLVDTECLAAMKVKSKFYCRVCNSSYTSNSNLNTHINSDHKGIKHNCEQCNKEFTTKQVKNVHVKTVHSKEKYKCQICQISQCWCNSRVVLMTEEDRQKPASAG